VRELKLEVERLHTAKDAVERRAERLLDEERSRLQSALQQRTADLDARSASHQDELLAAVQRAEQLRQAMAETEMGMMRKVSTCCFLGAHQVTPDHRMKQAIDTLVACRYRVLRKRRVQQSLVQPMQQQK
jgi:hypothetical protein